MLLISCLAAVVAAAFLCVAARRNAITAVRLSASLAIPVRSGVRRPFVLVRALTRTTSRQAMPLALSTASAGALAATAVAAPAAWEEVGRQARALLDGYSNGKFAGEVLAPFVVNAPALDSPDFPWDGALPDVGVAVDADWAEHGEDLLQFVGPAVAVANEVRAFRSGRIDGERAMRQAAQVAGGSVGGRAVGAGVGATVDVLTCGATLGLGTVIGGKIGAHFGKKAGVRAKERPLREAEAALLAAASAYETEVEAVEEESSRRLNTTWQRWTKELMAIERTAQQRLDVTIAASGRRLEAVAADVLTTGDVQALTTELHAQCDRLDSDLVGASWAPRWMVRRAAHGAVRQWSRALAEHLESARSGDTAAQQQALHLLGRTNTANAVLASYERRLLEEQVAAQARVDEVTAAAQAELERHSRRRDDHMEALRSNVERDVDSRVKGRMRTVRSCAAKVSEERHALGY